MRWRMTNFYAIEYSVSFANGAADRIAALAALLECIATERPRWHSVRLRLLKDSDPVSQAAAEGLSAKRFTTSRYFQYENWFLPVEGSFDEYYARRSSQVRNTIERKSKKLRKTHAIQRHGERDCVRLWASLSQGRPAVRSTLGAQHGHFAVLADLHLG